ncbi:hypothetical protein Efla_004695 [Eimeria flavescens]
MPASVTPAAASPRGAEQQQQQEPGFFARIGTVLFKIMVFQTLINFAASFFTAKPQTPMQQLPPLQNVLTPHAEFDLFMHLHYVVSPAVSPPAGAPGGPPGGAPPELNLVDSYRAKLGLLPPMGFAAAGGPLSPGERFPLKKLMQPSAFEPLKYCPRPAAAAAAEEDTAGGGRGGDTSAAAATGAANTAKGDCASPSVLPPPIEAWRLLGRRYTYDWWSKSETKEIQFEPHADLIKHEDLLLVLTVTAVPHTAYDGNRHEMNSEEVVAAAAALPTERLVQRSHSLIQKMKPLKKDEGEHSLLLGGEDDQKKEEEKAEPIRHIKTQLDVSLVYDTAAHTPATLAAGPLQGKFLRLATGEYEPMLDISDFWLIEKHFLPLNETLIGEPLTLGLSFGVGSVHAWLVQSQMAGVQRQQMQLGLQSDKEAFMFKRILLETNPFMLAFSAVFIICHSVFSFFAFKNDMQFWYKNESMEGLSAASLIFGFVCELVIGLYLFDSQETSWLILFEVFVGVAISAWKLTKAIKVEKQENFPFVKFAFTRSYSNSQTKDYDRTAITYASIALAPCLVGYAVYALLHNKYRSWYSYVISVLAGSVYTFGFVLMTPQLYINYKLKSVDHLPWRALIYRSLNTFVDDVASFLIDMPWMHRLSCFRDDIIFIVYLYQRWIYRVDKTRTVGPEGTPVSPAAASTSGQTAAPLRWPDWKKRLPCDFPSLTRTAAAGGRRTRKTQQKMLPLWNANTRTSSDSSRHSNSSASSSSNNSSSNGGSRSSVNTSSSTSRGLQGLNTVVDCGPDYNSNNFLFLS